MSAFDAKAIREGLVERLSTTGIFTYPLIPKHPEATPCFMIGPPESIDYNMSGGRGRDSGVFPIYFLISPQNPNAQEYLEGVLSGTGDYSVLEALYGDRTLNGACQNLRLQDVTVGMYTVTSGPEHEVWGCEFKVEVVA